jgi:hypothetical protein
MEFCRERNGAGTTEDVLDLIGRRDDSDPGSIHNRGTIVLTFANPGADGQGFQVRQPQAPRGGGKFERLAL